MKSGAWQAWTILAATCNRAASHLCRDSLRPRVPPAALHQSTKVVAESNSSWLSPGATVAPGSDIVPTLIVVSVTPGSVAPLAVPGPHTPLREPKSPLDAEGAGAAGFWDELDPPDRPHPAATST